MGEGKPPTVRGQLEQIIDTAPGQGCKDFDSFPAIMKAAVKSKPNVAVFTRIKGIAYCPACA